MNKIVTRIVFGATTLSVWGGVNSNTFATCSIYVSVTDVAHQCIQHFLDVNGDEAQTRAYVEQWRQRIGADNVFAMCGKAAQLLSAELWIEEAADEHYNTQEEKDKYIIGYFDVICFGSAELPLVREVAKRGLLEKAGNLFDTIQSEVYDRFLRPEVEQLNAEIQASMNSEQQPMNDNQQPRGAF